WGSVDAPADVTSAPQSTGTAAVRLTYVPDARPVVLRLSAGTNYTGRYFDPVTGITSDGPKVSAGSGGTFTVSPPAGCDHAWVITRRSSRGRSSWGGRWAGGSSGCSGTAWGGRGRCR